MCKLRSVYFLIISNRINEIRGRITMLNELYDVAEQVQEYGGK